MTASRSYSSEASNPFKLVRVTCPVCQNIITKKQLRTHLYVEQERDIDFHPNVIIWSDKVKDVSNPYLYYIWRCQKCGFAAGFNHFESPAAGTSIKDKIFAKRVNSKVEESESTRKLIDFLQEDIDTNPPDYLTGMKLLILAICYQNMVPEFVEKDSMNLAKYHMRLAWLFRDLKNDQELAKNELTKLKPFLLGVRERMPEFPLTEKALMEKAYDYYKNVYTKSYAVKTLEEEVTLVLLMARVVLQIENLNEARTLLAQVKERLAKFDSSFKRKVAESRASGNPLSKNDIEQNMLEISKHKSNIQVVHNIYLNLVQKYYEQDLLKAKKIIEKFPDLGPNGIIEKMRECSISTKVIKEYVASLKK